MLALACGVDGTGERRGGGGGVVGRMDGGLFEIWHTMIEMDGNDILLLERLFTFSSICCAPSALLMSYIFGMIKL